jgi:hypothetical protein
LCDAGKTVCTDMGRIPARQDRVIDPVGKPVQADSEPPA